MSENAIIGWPRWTEQFAYTAGSEAGTWAATNLGTLPLAKVWRSVSLATADTWIKAISATGRRVGILALVRHNLSLTARHRLRIYSDEAMTDLLYDSEWQDVWPVVYGPDDLEWEDDNWWTGQYSADEITGTAWMLPMWLDGSMYVAKGIHWEFDDADNADGYVQAGLVEIAGGWQVGLNFDYGAQFGFRPRTQLTESLGGVIYAERRDKPRVFQGAIQYMDRDEALARGFEHQRQADLDVPFLWCPAPDDPRNWLREAFLARNKGLGLLGYAACQRHSLPLNFEEAL